MAQPKWLMQITPTTRGLAKYPAWKHFPTPIAIYDKTDRDQRVAAARAALHAGDIAAFRCDPI